MKKKKKYFFGGNEPIVDNGTQAKKLAWESGFDPALAAINPMSPAGVGQMGQYDVAQLPPIDTSMGMAHPSQEALNHVPQPLPPQAAQQRRGWGVKELHPAFGALNVAMLATTGIANAINDGKTSRAERARYIAALQNRPVTNDPVLNENPMYFRDGGERKARKVDAIPTGYNFLREEGGRKFYNKTSAEALQVASGSNRLGGKEYDDFLINKLQSGVTVDELVAKRYLSQDKAANYAQYFRPNEDIVFMEGQQAQPQLLNAPARAARGQSVFLPNKHIAAEMFYDSRDSATNTDGGMLNTAGQRGTLRFRNDFGYTGEEVRLEGSDIQKYLGTSNTFGTDDIYKELKAKAVMAKMPYGGGPLTAEGAKEMLRDGKANGKKLTKKQKKYFGYIAGGGKPKAKYGVDVETGDADGMIKIADNAPTHEEGGVNVNNQVEVEAGEVVTLDGGEVERVLENTSTLRKDVVSKSLKITPSKFEAMFGFKVKKTLSHADALEEADKYYTGKRKKIENKLNQAVDILDKRPHDHYANNSVDLNLKTAPSIPDKDAIFDLLFEHQENIKGMLNVQPQRAQFGGKYIAKTGLELPIDPYKGDKHDNKGRSKKLPTKTSNRSKYDEKTWNDIKKALGYTGKDDNKEFQKFLDKKFPDLVEKFHSETDPEGYGIPVVTGKKLDGILGVRWDAIAEEALKRVNPPQTELTKVDNSLPAMPASPAIPTAVEEEVTPDSPFKLNVPSNRPSRFNEPLRWNDVAGPLMSWASSDRIGAQYNPVELNRIKLKQLNPTPALEAGQRDFNAAIGVLPNTGAGMANVTNAFASKYSLDNQVISQYENANVGIRNQEEQYNAGVGDRQSVADAQSRGTFEQHMLAGKEAQRQQKLKSFDDLFTRVALNRKLNREGNLLMQLAPNFDQYGEYNGNQRLLRNPMGNTPTSGAKVEYVNDPMGGRFRIIRDANGKVISRVLDDRRKVGLGF